MPARPDFPISPLDITEPDFVRDPVGNYAQIRRVGRLTYVPATRSILVAGYREAAAVLRDPAWHSMPFDKFWEKVGAALGRDYGPAVRLIRYMPIVHEDARHPVLRNMMAKGLAAIADDDPHILSNVAAKTDALRRNGGGDLVADVARHLLFDIMCDLMQIPHEDRRAINAVANVSLALDGSVSLKNRDFIVATVAKAVDYLDSHARATIGKTNPPFLTEVYHSLPADEDDRYFATASLATALLVMGNDALGACVAMGVHRLLDPARPGPAQPLWGALSDDAIRYSAPLDSTIRIASRDALVGGCPVPKGTNLYVSLMAANHDPEHYGARHADLGATDDVGLSFGAGRHICVGQRLSRAIVKAAFGALAGLPALRLSGPVRYGPGKLVRTFDSLPVEIV